MLSLAGALDNSRPRLLVASSSDVRSGGQEVEELSDYVGHVVAGGTGSYSGYIRRDERQVQEALEAQEARRGE